MCENFPNIRITEGNVFALLLPLRKRTYVASQPIDEDIDPTQLQNIVVTFGGVEYAAEATERGVQIVLPETLAVGTYDVLFTAQYLGSEIRAAYESAVTIVAWSAQSTAEQYIAGSPYVLRAAYVLSGTLTDAELEALKEEYREKNAQLDQAIADAEEAKREWEQKAADLDGVAQESTSQEILTAVENIDIDTSDLAKEATLEAVSDKIGTPAQGQPTDLFAAIAAGGGGGDGGTIYPTIQMTDTTASIEPNKVYIWGEVASLDISLIAGEAGVANVYFMEFYSGAIATTLTLPVSVTDVRGAVQAERIVNVAIFNSIAYIA